MTRKLRRLVALKFAREGKNGLNVADDASEKQPRYWPAIINGRRMTRDINNMTVPVCRVPYRSTLNTVRLARLALHELTALLYYFYAEDDRMHRLYFMSRTFAILPS